MIIKQYRDVIAGDKTETRRIADRYTVGKVYAVVPKMYKPTIWYLPSADGILPPAIWHEQHPNEAIPVELKSIWTPLRVKVVAKRKEPLQAINERGAIAEGIIWSNVAKAYYCRLSLGRWYETAVDGYRALWESINTKKGTRWEDNPLVNVITFEVVK